MATAKKTSTTKSTTAKTITASAPKRATTPRKTAQTIRNLRGTAVHLRFFSKTPKDPFRVQLNPRGQNGDSITIPVDLVDDPTLVQAIGVLVEVITTAEAQALRADYSPTGYLGRQDAPEIIRNDDTTVSKAPNWDGKGRLPQDRQVEQIDRKATVEFINPKVADVPGSDAALHAALRAGSSAMPAGALDQKVVIERAKQQD